MKDLQLTKRVLSCKRSFMRNTSVVHLVVGVARNNAIEHNVCRPSLIAAMTDMNQAAGCVHKL
jgi:hypothetical protein